MASPGISKRPRLKVPSGDNEPQKVILLGVSVLGIDSKPFYHEMEAPSTAATVRKVRDQIL